MEDLKKQGGDIELANYIEKEMKDNYQVRY